jgi:hypothetical protein
MDNTGLYLTYADLILKMNLAGSSKVVSDDITLSNKTVDVDGDIYEYVTSGSLQIGDVISQAGYADSVIEILGAPDRLRIIKTGEDNQIVNGPAKFLHSDKVPRREGEKVIQTAMYLIDKETGQFFNKREGTFPLEGNNTPIMHFSVPIIEITELKINSTDTVLTEGEDFDFVVFNGRGKPKDDRENPRIKLNVGKGRDSIFVNSITSRIFVKGALTHFTGSFGYLESDGSTPLLIQKATSILAMEDINNPIGGDETTTSGTGPLKRLKVDLHEQEFFEAAQNKESIKSSGTGVAAVDNILAKYRTPVRIGGSFIHRKSDEFPGRSSKAFA